MYHSRVIKKKEKSLKFKVMSLVLLLPQVHLVMSLEFRVMSLVLILPVTSLDFRVVTSLDFRVMSLGLVI